MHRHQIVLAAITAAVVATGCGSETTEPTTDKSSATATTQTAKPKAKSARSQMIACIEGVGFEVTHDDQPAATATNYTVEDDKPKAGWLKAVIIIHPDAATAEKSAQAGRAEDDLDDTAIGRSEYIVHAADDTEARVIGTCVADQFDS